MPVFYVGGGATKGFLLGSSIRKRVLESEPTNETWLREYVEAGDLLIFSLLKQNLPAEA